MATNGNQGNSNGHMTFTGTPDIKNGVSGFQQNRMAQRDFSNSFWKDKGYLSESIDELESMNKLYEDMSKVVDNMSKTQQKAYKEQLNALKTQLSYLKDIRQSGEVSDKEAIEAINSSNALRLKGQNDFLKLMRDGIITQEIADANHVKSIEDAAKKYNQIKTDSSDIEKKLANIAKLLENSGKSFTDSLTETLDKAGDKLANLSNMFNLQRIANNAMEQDARSKLSLMGSTSRQFGFTNNSQFESFKNSLNDTLKDMNSSMNSIFNSEDMRNYMANFSTYGITSTAVAQQQMKSSIIAEKYLGVSAETQTQIFKYMKRTNNNEVLAKHNQTIVGLLKSELGVSKEQLDALSQIAYGSVEDKSALGMSTDAIDAQTEAMEIIGASLSSMFGDATSKKIMESFNQFMLNPGSQEWASIFGGNYQSVYNSAYSANTKEGQIQAISQFLKGISNSNVLNYTNGENGLQSALGNKAYNNVTGLDNIVISALRGFNEGTYEDTLAQALEGVLTTTTDDAVEDFIEQSEESTWLQKIWNNIDTFMNGLPWKWTLNLANLAFTAYLASDLIKAGKGILSFFKEGGGFSKLFSSTKATADATTGLSTGASAGGAGLSALATGAAVVGLTAATIAAFSNISAKKWEEGEDRAVKDVKSDLANSNDPNVKKWANNGAMTHALAQSEQAQKSSWWDDTWNNVGGGFDTWYNNWFSGDYVKKNKAFWNWMNRSGVFTKNDQASGTRQRLAAYFLFDKAGSLESIDGVKRSDLVQIAYEYGPDVLQPSVTSIVNAGWAPSDRNGHKVDDKIDWESYTGKKNRAGGPSGGFVQSAFAGKGGDDSSWTNMIHSPWYRITSMWGNRPNPFGGGNTENHGGVDIAAPEGTPIGSATSGKVYTAGWVSGFGNAVYIQGDNGKKYIYGHMVRTPVVKSGQTVKAGQVIGYVGSTGRSTGNHLHFQVGNGWTKSQSVDPIPFLNTGVLYPGGDITGISGYNSSNKQDNSTAGVPSVKSKRFIPKSFGNATDSAGGPADGATRIVGSVNGGFKNLINYLDSIREEQTTQRAMLEAFSKSRMSESSF